MDESSPLVKMALREMRIVVGAILLDGEANEKDIERKLDPKRRSGVLESFGYRPSEPLVQQAAISMAQMAQTGRDPYMHMLAEIGEARAMVLSGEVTAWAERKERAGTSDSIPRNRPCPCGSGRKFKKCCMAALQEIERGGQPQPKIVQ
jgi:hypothetical protein